MNAALGIKCDSSQTLPPKWDCFFKQVIKQYESKQYEKALRSVNEMLNEGPEYAEAKALKGHLLILNGLTSIDPDALDLGRQAVRLNIRSVFCWRILGKIYHALKNYAEAIKCYRQAVRLDSSNTHLMYDLANMETCERDPGLIKTRAALLTTFPSDRMSWMGLAIAHDLNGDFVTAANIIDELERSSNAEMTPAEKREHLLYKVRLLIKQSKYSEALDLLSCSTNNIPDKKIVLLRAECLLNTGDFAMADSTYRAALHQLSDSREVLSALVSIRVSFAFSGNFREYETDPEKSDEIKRVLDDLATTSALAKNIALGMSRGSEFSAKLRCYVTPYVEMNIPSVFSDIKRFYESPDRTVLIENCLIDIENELVENRNFSGRDYHNPAALLWVYLLLCMHYIRTSNISMAHHYLTKSKEHTPTADMVYVLEARLSKLNNDKNTLLHALKMTTQIDPKDRFSSNRYVKHLIRNHEYEHAANVFKNFNDIRDKEILKHIVDIQCIWYEQELATASYQTGDILTALQLYLLIINHFRDFRDQESEFHHYCLRRGTYCAYIDTLENNDQLKAHPSWLSATVGAVQCLVDVFDAGGMLKLESQRTSYGRSIAENVHVGQLPDFTRPLAKAIDLLKDLERFGSTDPSVFLLSSLVHLKVENYAVSAEKLKIAVSLGLSGSRVRGIVAELEKVESFASVVEEIHILFKAS